MRSGKCCKKREMAKQFTLSLFQIDTGKHLKMTAIQSFVGASDRKCHLYARTLLCWNSVTCSDTAQLRGLNLYGRCLAWTANETISVGTGGKWGGMLGNICRGSCVRRMRNHWHSRWLDCCFCCSETDRAPLCLFPYTDCINPFFSSQHNPAMSDSDSVAFVSTVLDQVQISKRTLLFRFTEKATTKMSLRLLSDCGWSNFWGLDISEFGSSNMWKDLAGLGNAPMHFCDRNCCSV